MMGQTPSGGSITQENRRRVLLIAATTGYQTRAFVEAAHRQGIDIVMATDRCHILDDPWGDSAIPVKLDSPEESVYALSALTIDGIVALGDRPAVIAALAAEKLGVPLVAAVDDEAAYGAALLARAGA